MTAIEGRTWSVSAMRTYTCPRAWWLQYVAQVDVTDTETSSRGQLMHLGLATGYATIYAALTAGKARVVAIDLGVDALVDVMQRFADDYNLFDEDAEEAIDVAANALDALGPQPGDQMLGTEVTMNITLHGVAMVCRADLLYRRGGRLVVRDWKSAKSLPTRHELLRNRQMGVGALCAARTFNVTDIGVEIASISSAASISAPMHRNTAMDAALAVVRTARHAETHRDFKAIPHEHCGDCKVRAHCPLFAPAGTVITAPDAWGDPMEVTIR